MSAASQIAAGHSELSRRVIQAVADVLGVPQAAVTGAASLFDLPGFDSLAVVSVLERLESGLSVEVPPELIVPEAFDSLAALTGLLARAQAAPSAHPATGGPA
jgi:acyl carrier protein